MPLTNAGRAARCIAPGLLAAILLVQGCSDGSDTLPATREHPGTDGFSTAGFAQPARKFHPWIRWWWPGGAVDHAQLEVELDLLLQAGFGGVEVQSFARQLTPAELARVPDWGSPGFLAALAAAADAATARGMGFDVTLGSAYPAGAPSIAEARARQLLLGTLDVVGPGVFAGPLPPPQPQAAQDQFGPFDTAFERVAVAAARVVDATARPPLLDDFVDVGAALDNGGWDVPAGNWRVFAAYQNSAQQLVKYAAYAADSFVADHLDARGARELIREVGEPLLEAADIGAIFIDSIELTAELPWSRDLLARFRDSKGYDPSALLPLLFSNGAETNIGNFSLGIDPRYAAANGEERVREDYADVRGAAFLEEHLVPLQEWATSRGVQLRVQAHGGFANFLDGYAAVDIPETEFFYGGGSYDFLKLAPSAAHITGRRVVPAESFVTLVPNPRALQPEDFRLLAGRAASAGVTRIAYHGFTHRFVQDSGDTWYPWGGFFNIGSRIDELHPVWAELPALNTAFARTAYALTRGRHAADLAWLYTDAQPPGGISFGAGGPRRGESQLSRTLLNAGLVYDRVSPGALEAAHIESDPASGRARFRVGQATYPALLLAGLESAHPALLATVERICEAGIPTVVVGGLPSRARGWADHVQRDAAVAAAVARLGACIHHADTPDAGRALLAQGVVPAVQDADGAEFPFSPERRTLAGGELLLLFNESDGDLSRRLRVNLDAARLRVFDPDRPDAIADMALGPDRTFQLQVPARRSRILLLER